MHSDVLCTGRPPEPRLGEVGPLDWRRLTGAGVRGGEREARVVIGGPVGGRAVGPLGGSVEVQHRGPQSATSASAREHTGRIWHLRAKRYRAQATATRRSDYVVQTAWSQVQRAGAFMHFSSEPIPLVLRQNSCNTNRHIYDENRENKREY